MVKKRKKRKLKTIRPQIDAHATLLAGGLIFLIFGMILGFRMGMIQGKQITHYGEREMTKVPENIKPTLAAVAKKSATLKVPILMYHYVEYVKDEKDTIRKSLNIIPAIFHEQVMALKNAGYNFVTMNDVANALNGNRLLPDKPIVLTFDDGYRDFYTDVFPILRKNNIQAVAYIIPGLLEDPNYMTHKQLLDVAKSGIIEIGAHTIHHPYLKGMSKKEAEVEISGSKKMLENILKTKIVSFAYPYGAFDEQAIELVKKAGYTNAVSTIEGFEENQGNKYFMYRVRPGIRIGEELLGYLMKNTTATLSAKEL